jgi:hypothetical protein
MVVVQREKPIEFHSRVPYPKNLSVVLLFASKVRLIETYMLNTYPVESVLVK